MVQVSYPGVYIQEEKSGVHTITGVSTSIAAFFGRTAKGQINKAVRCLSYTDFLREFGGPHPLSDLAQSVKQFFDNGGTDCYVIRLAKGAIPASVTLQNLAKENVLTATAKAQGTWGQDIKLEVDYNTTNPDDSFNLRVTYLSNGTVVSQEQFYNLSMNPTSPRFAPTFVTQSSKLIDLTLHADMGDPNQSGSTINKKGITPAGYSQSRRPFEGNSVQELLDDMKKDIGVFLNPPKPEESRFAISVNGNRYVDIDLRGVNVSVALNRDGLKDILVDAINLKLQAEDATWKIKGQWDAIIPDRRMVLRFTSDGGDNSAVNIRRAAANDFAAAMMFGLDQGGIEIARYSNMRPVPNGSYYMGGVNYGDFTDGINSFAALNQIDINKITLNAGSDVETTLNLITGGTLMYEQIANGLDGVREKLRLIMQAVNTNPNSPCTAELWGYHLVFKRKTGTINDTAIVTTAGTNLNGGFLFNVRQYSLGAIGASKFQSAGTAGVDGTYPELSEYVGESVIHTGFYALDKVDLFNLMILPGDKEVLEQEYIQLIGPATTYCQQRRAFLLVDAPESWTSGDRPDADASKVNKLRIGIVKDHAAVFYPKVKFSDAGLKKTIGASGIVAGLMARTDSQRGVWKAPAGIEADMRGVLDVEVNLTDMENGVLNKLGVNCVRKSPNGIVNWGARTLSGFDDNSETEWKYIPIRRLALFLEESLYRGTKWIVFEPNDEPLWAQIRLNLGSFMNSLFRQGAFQGKTTQEAYFVKCDKETTTQNDRNLGIVNIIVGFAPLKPAEFVIIKIQQIAGELQT